MVNKVKCTCGHSWNKSDSSKKDATVCHICGKDNAMKNGGWLDKYSDSDVIPQAQFGKIVPEPTKGDSIVVLNSTLANRNYYNDLMKKGVYKSNVDKTTYDPGNVSRGPDSDFVKELKRKKLTSLMDRTKEGGLRSQRDILQHKGTPQGITAEANWLSNHPNKTHKDYEKVVAKTLVGIKAGGTETNPYKYYYKDLAPSVIDPDAPFATIDTRIQPQYNIRYAVPDPYNSKASSGSWVDTVQYDPLAVTPWDMLNPQQQKQRLDQFGTSGTPYADPKYKQQITQKPKPGGWKSLKTFTGTIEQPKPKPEPTLKPRPFVPATKIPIGEPSKGMQIQQREMPKLDVPNVNMSGPYMVGYTDYDTQQGVDRGFATAEERDAFYKQLSERQAGNYQPGQGNISSYYDVNRKLAMGGSLPGATGFMYARTGAPSEGPYAKKTLPSAQNGQEMSYYQNGLDWKPKSISRDGSEVPKAQTGDKVCGPNQVYLEGTGCIDIRSRMYKELYESGKLVQKGPDESVVFPTMEPLVVNSKLTEDQKRVLLRKDMQETSAQNQTQISSADQPWYQRAYDIATHPGTAIRAYNKTGYVPSNLSAAAEEMGGSSSVVNSLSPFTWGKAAVNATKQFGSSPFQTTKDVLQGTGNLLGYGIHQLDSPLFGQTMPEYKSPFGDAGTNARALEFAGNVGEAIPLLEFVGPSANLSKVGLRKSVDLVSPVGRELRAVEKYGKLNNLTEAEIKNMQMQKVGITSKQREGYFPGVSEIFSEYLTPYGYDNMGKRLLNIPKRIIKGETNTKKIAKNLVDVVIDQGETLLSKPRYDAWRMYSGLPQEYGTFRLAETSPLNHSSYPKGSLDNTEIFSLNDERRLLNDVPNKDDLLRYRYSEEDLVDDLDYLKGTQSDLDQLNNSTKIYATDFGTTNLMGGHNRRFFDNVMEYNDIWDLNPGNLKVDKYFGKPFMSHGQVPYNINDIQSELSNYIRQGERLKEYSNIKTNPYKNTLLTDKWNNQSLNIPNSSIVVKKQKEGGIIKDDNGYWNPDNWGKVVEIDSPDITMKGVNQPLVGISDEGDVQYMEPGKDYKFKGKKVKEYPVGKNGVNQQDEKVDEQLDQLTNFTNYNKPTKGGWLDNYQ
jgi:hypothetical protein